MTGLRKYWVMLGCVLAGTSMACLALTRSEIPAQHNTGPWLFGHSEARWTVTEFADLECPYCKTYTPALKTWIQQQKNVNLQWHHLPLDVHGSAAVHEAKLAECAGVLGGAPAFWQAIDQIFDRTRSNGQGFKGDLNVVGVTNQALLSCAANDKVIAQHVDQQADEAIKAGVTATPTVIIRDNTTGSSVKLEGPADGVLLLSAIDWLAQKKEQRHSKKFDR
ncbi:DsbA family protein [Pseudomonas sp. SWRI22]|uniref:DsbA family protein n=1 Tax=Pseudomonas TaxID=286 RepID=UPI001645C912|nr:DsbA family protein [Pseudomonas sp. SWRI22]MBV4510238.1 DsbA family protein [Pseudomonas sp. SWRI22]